MSPRSFANGEIEFGYIVGNGAAQNIELGYVPHRVEVYNVTDGDIITVGFFNKMIAFTSGGTNVPVANQKITGITSGAVARIKSVLLISGTFAGGDAAGWFVCDADDVTGTFTSENVTLSSSAAATDDATVVVQVEHGYKIDTATAAVTGTSGLLSYLGDATTSPPKAKGFTIGSVVSESAKLLRWTAWR